MGKVKKIRSKVGGGDPANGEGRVDLARSIENSNHIKKRSRQDKVRKRQVGLCVGCLNHITCFECFLFGREIVM